MKVYFNYSVRGLEKYRGEYAQIHRLLHDYGLIHTFSNDFTKEAEKTIYAYTEENLQNLYTEAIRALSEADIVVLELSIHSFSQGYLVKRALDQGKPVVGLHHTNEKVAFAAGITDDNFQVYEYDLKTIADVLNGALDYAFEKSDIRFNMMLSSKLNNYLKWVARDMRISRATFIRNLLQDHLQNNSRYIEK